MVDTPGIELIAEEAAALGAERLAIVVAPQKQEIMAHFGEFAELQELMVSRGKDEQAKKVSRAFGLIDAVAVTQDAPLGLGHAVGCAEAALDAEEDVVAVMLPDDLVLPFGVMEKMVRVREQFGGSVLCAFNVTEDEVFNYGVFDVEDANAGVDGVEVKRVRGMVEKPAKEEAPSTLVATGRYLLDRAVFDALRRITPGKGGELQLTDAIELMIQEGHPVHVVVHDGKRHDLGNPGGYIPANVDFGLRDAKYGPALYTAIKQILADFEAEHPEVAGNTER